MTKARSKSENTKFLASNYPISTRWNNGKVRGHPRLGGKPAKALLPFYWIMIASSMSGCSAPVHNVFASIDQSDRSIAMPGGAFGISAMVKNQLARDGWDIRIQGNAANTTTNGQGSTTSANGGARYILRGYAKVVDPCIFGTGSTVFVNFSLIDNSNSKEIFSYAGRACEGQVADDLVNLIEERKPTQSGGQ